jgi:HK97 family phage portal protein
MAKLTLLDLGEAKAEALKFRNTSGASTLAAPSADLVQALLGFPASAGKVVTRATAQRVGAVLSSVKTIAADIAKMPLVVYEQTKENGRIRTQPAIDHSLYPIFKYQPNRYQIPFSWQFFLTTQLLMNGNCFCQKITNSKGDIIELVPLDAWSMSVKWDYDAPLFTAVGDPITNMVNGKKVPVLRWDYYDGQGKVRPFYQPELFHVVNLNIEGNGFEGASMIALGKEAISLLMAAEEVHGRNFANGLGMGGFISFPPDSSPEEPQAQALVDRLKKDFSGSQNAGKFTVMPYGGKWEKMSFNAQESQLLDSRKWSAQEVARMFGGAPLIVKLGLSEQNSTYASSSAFLDEYFNTTLLPYTTAFEQTVVRDLLDPSERGKVYVKHNADIILRGSPKERAETNAELINSAQLTPNEARAIEDRDWIEGGDILVLASNSSVFDIEEQEWFIPGQKPPVPNEGEGDQNSPNAQPQDEPDAAGAGEDNNETEPTQPAPKPKKKAKNRLELMAHSAANRVMRAAEKKELDPKFVMGVCMCPPSDAEEFCQKFKSLTAQESHDALVALVIGDSNDSEE